MLEQKDIEKIRDVVEIAVEPIVERLDVLEKDVVGLKEDVVGLKEDVVGLKEDVEGLKEDVAELKEDVEGLKQVTEKTQHDVIKINLTLENIVMPRLCTIEDCYTSTYRRYADGVEQFETMQMDIDILKETVAQHGEKLQRLA